MSADIMKGDNLFKMACGLVRKQQEVIVKGDYEVSVLANEIATEAVTWKYITIPALLRERLKQVAFKISTTMEDIERREKGDE